MGFDYQPRHGPHRLMHDLTVSLNEEPKAEPHPVIATATAPQGPKDTPPFDPSIKPKSKAEGAQYMRELVHAIEIGDIKANSMTEKDFNGIDLHGADLKGINLKVLPAVAFSNINFDNCDLTDQKFKGPMQKFQAKGANLTGATFENATLDGANLENTKLDGATFSGGSAIGAKLTHAKGDGVKFKDINCDGASFAEADLSGHMIDVSMNHVKGRRFNMAGLSFEGEKMSFKGAEFQEALVNSDQKKRFDNPITGLPPAHKTGMKEANVSGKLDMGATPRAWAGVPSNHPSPYGNA